MQASRVVVLTSSIALVALSVHAGVKLKINPDGTTVMYNDGRVRKNYRSQPPRLIDVSNSDLDQLIVNHARRKQLDPDLVRAVIQVESAYRPGALSQKGAMGLMQLMPETAQELSVDDPWDPGQNVRGGTDYLRYLIDLFGGKLELALAGYNAGPTAVERYGGIPPYQETRNYVERVMRIYRDEPGFSVAASSIARTGRKTYLIRDTDGRLVMTTTPPIDR